MKEFNTMGTISFEFSIDVEASTEEEAQKQALETIRDYYLLNMKGAYHHKEDVKITELDTEEYED